MEELKLTGEETIKAFKEFITEDLLETLASVFPTWRLLAEGRPVSPEQVANALNKPVDQVRNDLSRAEEIGFFGKDEQGNIVNFFGLSLNPTPHRLDIGGQELFAG